MKKTVILGLIFLVSMGAMALPVASVAHAQTYGYPTSYTGSYTGTPECLNLTSYLTIGTSNAYTGGQVSELQEFLNQTGYLSGVSGTFDQGTYGAVINFQNAHGIVATGTVGPETSAAIRSITCGSTNAYVAPVTSYNTTYPSSTYSPYTNSNGQTCSWNGSTYVCSYVYSTPTQSYVAPVQTGYTTYPYQNETVYPSGENECGYNNYNTINVGNEYSNGYNCGNEAPELNSLSSSYNSNGVDITIQGYGFSNVNTVHFGTYTFSNVYSNGTTLSFTVPYSDMNYETNYINTYSSNVNNNYSITVANAYNVTSNALTFTMNQSQYQNENCSNEYTNYNSNNYFNPNCTVNENSYTNAPILSSISGPSNVTVGTTNTWNVTLSNGENGYNNYSTGDTVSVNWGDNYGSNNANTQQSYSTSQQTFSFSHTYVTPGSYAMRITATNSSGESVSQTLTVEVTSNGQYYY